MISPRADPAATRSKVDESHFRAAAYSKTLVDALSVMSFRESLKICQRVDMLRSLVLNLPLRSLIEMDLKHKQSIMSSHDSYVNG